MKIKDELQADNTEITLLKDSELSIIDGEIYRVLNFTSLTTVKDSKIRRIGVMPAGITIECKKAPAK
ncbi:hypothetical protein KBG31_02590 [Patescibacteria group bacterium]|nr:hypothetical protein [Patescibacteria group bacterium]